MAIGVLALALSAGLAWGLASALVAPMRRVAFGVRALSDGDYTSRIDADRSDELGALIDDVNHLARTLEIGRESRQRWIASISHELRTPLTILVGELQALRDGIRPLDDEAIESLSAEADRMSRLVEDLYQMSVTDLGGLRYEWAMTDLTGLTEDILGGLRDGAGDGFELDVEPGVDVRGDTDRLAQLLLNLGNNSIAYSDPPATRRVRLSTASGHVHLVLEDSEPGVDEASCERLFEPLFRMDASRSRRTGGAGLGMAICKNIVEAHGGTISASPSELGGLRVEVIVPLETRSV